MPSSAIQATTGARAASAADDRALDGAILQRFVVPVEYSVLFQDDCLDPAHAALAALVSREAPALPQRVLCYFDAGFAGATPGVAARLVRYAESHAERFVLLAPPFELPGGEKVKETGDVVLRLHQQFLDFGLDRHSVVLVFGGGALLDAVGYAAATFHRGLRLVRVPTTVLAQNDAGLGVKNGLNALGHKNLVGTFAAPFGVLCDSTFLSTLSVRDRRAGMAEAVKVALVKDRAFFEWLEAHAAGLARGDETLLGKLVRGAAELHLAHIAQGGDPFERGSGRPLDYGHWSAHKLEALSRHELRHGEAVAIGMALDGIIARRLGILPAEAQERVHTLLRALGFSLHHPALLQRDSGRLAVLSGIEEFRQHMGGELTIPLLSAVGSLENVHALDEALVESSIHELCEGQ